MAHDLSLFSKPPKELEDHPLFSKKHTVGVVTAENPMVAPAVPGGNNALKDLLTRWKLPHEEVKGHYGGPEKSFIVQGPTREQMFHLGRMFGQEAVIYGHHGLHEMLFSHGPKAGNLHPGHGVFGFHPTEAPPDYYTELPGKGYVRLHFDQDQLVPAPLKPAPYLGPVPGVQQETQPVETARQAVAKALRKAVEMATKPSTSQWAGHYPWHEGHAAHNHKGLVAGILVPSSFFHLPMSKAEPPGATHPHTAAHGTAADFSGGKALATNEQAGVAGTSKSYGRFAAPYGTVDKTRPSSLKFYPLEGKQQAADALVQHHGYQTYYAGGKHGKPDLASKNYTTGHLMVYDPQAGSGGDFGETSYTDAWRKTHELAHALTLGQLNSKYGEGRRMGSLGKQRTPREAKRAVEWEWLAAHRQRDILKNMGVHVSDEDFHRELNTIMHDAVHRAVTGKFSDPQEEGFRPHSHKVPLETALGMVDEAGRQMGLRGEHDLIKR